MTTSPLLVCAALSSDAAESASEDAAILLHDQLALVLHLLGKAEPAEGAIRRVLRSPTVASTQQLCAVAQLRLGCALLGESSVSLLAGAGLRSWLVNQACACVAQGRANCRRPSSSCTSAATCCRPTQAAPRTGSPCSMGPWLPPGTLASARPCSASCGR